MNGVDYDVSFSLEVKMTPFLVIFGLTTTLNLEVVQLDFRKTFLHGDLEDDVYMDKLE